MARRSWRCGRRSRQRPSGSRPTRGAPIWRSSMLGSRDWCASYRWGFVEPPIVGGALGPTMSTGFACSRPAGCSIAGGRSPRKSEGLPRATDSVRIARRQSPGCVGRDQDVTAVLGGRHLGTSDGPVTMLVKFRGAQVDSWQLKPGFFVRQILLPAGESATVPGYLPLEVTAESASHVPVSLEQFDAQGPGTPMVAYDEGWHEPEYSPEIGRAWRWASERARLWVRPIGRAVTLRMTGESPRRYFDAAPTVRVLVAGREVSSFQPFSDFNQTASLPARSPGHRAGPRRPGNLKVLRSWRQRSRRPASSFPAGFRCEGRVGGGNGGDGGNGFQERSNFVASFFKSVLSPSSPLASPRRPAASSRSAYPRPEAPQPRAPAVPKGRH